jgi:hypothetical protein
MAGLAPAIDAAPSERRPPKALDGVDARDKPGHDDVRVSLLGLV